MPADLVSHPQFWGLLRCLTTQEHNSSTDNKDAALENAQAFSARHFAEAVTTCPNSAILVYLAKQAGSVQQTALGVEREQAPFSAADAALERRSASDASLQFAQDRSQAGT